MAGVILLAAVLPVVLAAAIYLAATARAPRPAPRRDWTVPPELRRRLVRAGAAGAAVAVATRWPVAALAAAVLGWYLPELVGSRAGVAADIERAEAVATWTEMLRDNVLGPAGLEGAIVATAPLAPDSLRPQVLALAARLPRQPPPQALAAFADEADHPVADFVVAGLSRSYDCPSAQLGSLLTTLASYARDEAAMRLRIDTARSRIRTSVKVLVTSMAATALSMALVARDLMAVYSTPAGQAVLTTIVVLWAIGLSWLARLSRLRQPARFFSARPTPAGLR
ncbi:MAG: hypothetical protein KY439_00025 [Actinobacteria bacterium]|nr:hypothetical protein [Actinomycetota bacterium]